MQTTLSGNLSADEVYIFGDESGSEKEGFLAYGLVCIEKKDLTELYALLQKERELHECCDPIHYNELKGCLSSSKYKTALGWLNLVALDKLPVYFEYLEVDQTHEQYDIKRFGVAHHIYHLWYKIALKKLIHKKYKGRLLKLKIVLHHKSQPKEVDEDPYDKIDYLTCNVKLFDKVKVVDVKVVEMSATTSEEAETVETLALQLSDLLLGSTRNAIHGTSDKRGKIEAGGVASSIFHKEIKKFPVTRRKCDYSRFPNFKGEIYGITSTIIDPVHIEPPGRNYSLTSF
ncbi:MAG: hypothetical protein KJ771_07065 [Nanoarchaeota archaeon]|nr:hypothetical protein [Nanoarchaeota archaeon]